MTANVYTPPPRFSDQMYYVAGDQKMFVPCPPPVMHLNKEM